MIVAATLGLLAFGVVRAWLVRRNPAPEVTHAVPADGALAAADNVSSRSIPAQKWTAGRGPGPLDRPRSRSRGMSAAPTPSQAQLCANQPEQMLELRNALTWRLLDEHGEAIAACGRHTTTRLVCWHRFQVSLEQTQLHVLDGEPLRCTPDDFAAADPGSASPEAIECLRHAVAPVGDVYVNDEAASALAGYRGDLDVFFVVRATAPVRSEEP